MLGNGTFFLSMRNRGCRYHDNPDKSGVANKVNVKCYRICSASVKICHVTHFISMLFRETECSQPQQQQKTINRAMMINQKFVSSNRLHKQLFMMFLL